MNGTSMKTGGERVRRRPVCSLENPRWSDSEGLAYPPQLECPPMLGTEQTGDEGELGTFACSLLGTAASTQSS